MELFNNNNNSSERVTRQSFAQWASEHHLMIQSRLIDEGIAFLNHHGESLKTPVFNLILDNRWHYLDKPTKKQSYRATLEHHNDGVPHLSLTYYTFRQGGRSERFDNKAVLKALWQEARGASKLALVTPPLHTSLKPLNSKAQPETPSMNWVAHDHTLWQAMSLTGTSHYLKRKGLGDVEIPGIRYAKQNIAVAIIDTSNTFLGLQRIFNDGQKRFTKGLFKKGHFALIGAHALPERLATLHVCEGVATAASIYRATGEPVFSALDAFNLLPVCKSLKRHYPKTSMIIWADNDWQKAETKTKFGRVIGNTGLIQANRTAFKLRNTLVCTPDFSTLDVAFTQNATDFNDLHQLKGLASLSETQPQKPDIQLSLWRELHRYTQYTHGALSPQQFTHGTKKAYDSRYLPHDVFKQEGVHLVRSAIGTGKTELVERLVKQNPKQSILFTTHLISLVENAASRLGLASYNECDNFDLQIENRLAICLNSLGKLTAEGALRPYEVVIIDEIEQVLARLTSPIEQKPLIFSVLQHLMAQAKTLICLDAHLSQTTVQLIQRFCPHQLVTIHFNTFKPGSEREIVFHDNPESVQMTAMQMLEQEKKVYLTFNSKKEAFKTYSTFNIAFPEKKGLYISSDNAGDEEIRAFFNQVNDVSKRYDYLICTPSVSTGVSIDNAHFDFVGGIFNAQVNTANDCMQALGRVRNHKTLHVFCDKRQAFKSLNPEVIASKWLKTHEYDMELMRLNSEGHRILLNPDYEQLSLLVTQARNRSFNDFYQQFALLALHDGMKLSYFDTVLNTTTQQQLRQLKKACVAQDTALMSQTQLSMNAADILSLSQKPRKTMEESRQYKKKQLIEFYNLSEKDEVSIHAMAHMDNEGRFRKQILALELALGDETLAKKRFLAQIEAGEQFAADLTHYATLQQLYKKLLDTLCLTMSHDKDAVKTLHNINALDINQQQYTKETIKESDFISWVEEQRTILQGIIPLPSTLQLQREPLRFISMLLGRLGLKQKRVGRAEMGNYQLDGERIILLNAIMLRRAKGVLGTFIPIDISSYVQKTPTTTEVFVEKFKKIKQFFTVQPSTEECVFV